MTVRITKNTIDLKGLGELDAQRVDVGFLADATYPDGTPVSLVAAVNEFGTSDGSIPERPFMRNALRNARKAVLDAVADGIRDSDDASIDSGTAAKAGEVLAGAIQASITDLRSPPNAPSTVRRKGSTNPLLDTGLLRQSVSRRLVR